MRRRWGGVIVKDPTPCRVLTPCRVNGQVVGGLWSFGLPGQQVKQTWARATVDVDHRLSNKVALTVGANTARSGGDATWGVTAGLRAAAF